MRFDHGTLDSGERSLPFGLLVCIFNAVKTDTKLTLYHMGKLLIIKLTKIKFKIWRVTFFKSFLPLNFLGWTSGFRAIDDLLRVH